MTTQLNSEQLTALTDLAKGVKQDYVSLEITEILNRIHYITGRDFKKCIEGFKLMFGQGLIASNFILRIHLLPKIEAMIDKTFPLIVAMEGELINFDEMNEGPKDDPDEVDDVQSLPDGPDRREAMKAIEQANAPVGNYAEVLTSTTLFNLDSNF